MTERLKRVLQSLVLSKGLIYSLSPLIPAWNSFSLEGSLSLCQLVVLNFALKIVEVGVRVLAALLKTYLLLSYKSAGSERLFLVLLLLSTACIHIC